MTARLLALVLLAVSLVATAQEPVIDMHLHASGVADYGPPPLAMCTPFAPHPVWDQRRPYAEVWLEVLKNPRCSDPVWSPGSDEALLEETLAALERHNVIGVLGGPPARVKTWRSRAPDRIIPGLGFLLGSRAPSVDELRAMIGSGEVQVLAEIVNQYIGVAPDDPRMEPYWALAEELDIPVGIHIGPGPPGVHYLGSDGYRAHLHSALTLEPVLVRHPKLRIYVMHAGYPMLDDMLALMYAHPQVHVEVGVIVYTEQREAFYRYLEALVDGGFGPRVMFGSDQMVWPGTIGRAIRVIEEAPFLTAQQKRDILYHNAARFLRLDEATMRKHRAMAGGKDADPPGDGNQPD